MTDVVVLELGRNAIITAATVALPVLAAGMLTGLMIAVFQAVTQINEMTLAFVPKIVAVAITAVFFGPWMLGTLLNYINNLFVQLPTLVR